MTQRPPARVGARPAARLRRLIALGATLALAVTGCSQGRAGTAIPDGDQAAEYVTAKFSTKLEALSDDLTSREPRRSSHRSFTRIDDKKADNTNTAIQVGSPPSRLHKNHSNRDSSDYRDYFHPAGSDVEYIRLGPVYKNLAPTEWVSIPYTASGLNVCFWGGYTSVCRMLTAVSQSVEDRHAAKSAKSFGDGSVELTAEVTLREFLDQRVVVLPDWALDAISEKTRDGILNTQISLGPQGELKEIRMRGKISEDGHEIEINEHYQVLDPPTEEDLPKVPSPKEVTALKTEKQVDDFYDRMGRITSAGG